MPNEPGPIIPGGVCVPADDHAELDLRPELDGRLVTGCAGGRQVLNMRARHQGAVVAVVVTREGQNTEGPELISLELVRVAREVLAEAERQLGEVGSVEPKVGSES